MEKLLGGTLDAAGLHWEALVTLVESNAVESEQLEFKGHLGLPYGDAVTHNGNWSNQLEFGKDVAAFANHRGGVIIIGIKEAKYGSGKLIPVEDVEAGMLERQLRSFLLNTVAPEIDVDFVPIAAPNGGYCMAVIIPPSPRTPHAVVRGRPAERLSLHYPIRVGSETRWLNEHEVAERYRHRQERVYERRQRKDEVVDNGIDALNQASGLWLYSAIIPDIETEGRIDARLLDQVEVWYRSENSMSPTGRPLLPTASALAHQGRVILSEGSTFTAGDFNAPQHGHAELHVRGSAFAAVQVIPRCGVGAFKLEAVAIADAVQLTTDLCLRWAGGEIGARGPSTVIVGMLDAEASEVGGSGRPLVLVEGDPYSIDGGKYQTPRTRQLFKCPKVEFTSDLRASTDISGRLSVVHVAVSLIMHNFGVPECKFVRRDGSVVLGTWGTPNLEAVKQWASRTGARLYWSEAGAVNI